MIRAAGLLWQNFRPGILSVVENEGDQLNQRLFRGVTGGIGPANGGGRRAATTKQPEEILSEDEAQYQQDERPADSQMHPAELESSAPAGIVAAIFDVLAFITRCPAHDGSLLGLEGRMVTLGPATAHGRSMAAKMYRNGSAPIWAKFLACRHETISGFEMVARFRVCFVKAELLCCLA